jgi:ribosomal protein S18 acetylase RimI-like enzyme
VGLAVPRRIEWRRATLKDRDFLEEVHVRALGPIALVGYGWTATKTLAQFRSEIDLRNCEVIVVDGRAAGYVSTQDRGAFWYIDAFAIAPRYQRKGIGTAVMRDLLLRAGTVPVRLNVLHVNPARALYERLGFRILSRDGARQVMEWRALV